MDYRQFNKKLSLPKDFQPPLKLEFEDLVATPLSLKDLEEDLEAVNSSIEIIQKTRGGGWPDGYLTKEFNFLDLAWHEREFRDNDSFAYVIYDKNNKYIGCFYLYPMGLRTELTSELLDYDIDASWWVTTTAYEQGHYQKLYKALQHWLDEFPFKKIYYSNREIPE